MSLRRRLIVAFVAVALVLIGTNIALWGTFRSFLLDRLDRQLISATSALADRRPPPRGPDWSRCLGIGEQQQEALTEYSISCLDANSGRLWQFTSPFRDDEPKLDADEVVAHAARPRERPDAFGAPSSEGSSRWRLVASTSPATGNIVIVGVALDQLETTLRRIRAVQLFSTTAVLAALSLVLWWMLRLGVHPLESMARTADEIAAGDLSRRVTGIEEGTEAGRLATAFNSMLERISDAFRAREASEDRVRRFAADASHELRTPLTSIRGYAELWRAGGLRDEAELAEAMRRMEQEAERMGALVEDLLLLARLDQHRALERQPVRLDVLAADGVQDARAVEPERSIDIIAEPVTIPADERQVRQVVANLLSNALVHTPTAAAVHVKVGIIDGRAFLEVADEGPGMTPEAAAQVFERFFRADVSRTRQRPGGTGLGLSIVEAIASAHGGRARVDSAPGKGSRFLVEFPLSS